jgi:ubiquitin-protein ligase
MAWWKAGPTPREVQLSALEQAFPEAKKTVQGNACHYDMICLGGSISLRVFLPPRFPEEKPVLQLMHPLNHSWVTPHNQVAGHPGLARWHKDVKLAGVLAEVLAELAGHLPSSTPPPV